MMEHYYRQTGPRFEYCFNIETDKPLTPEKQEVLKWLLRETFEPDKFGAQSLLAGNEKIVEVGPRMNFATSFSTCAVNICHACGLTEVTRIERSKRYVLPAGADEANFITANHDRMTEQLYLESLKTFKTGIEPEATFTIPLIEQGPDALRKLNAEMGLGMDDWDIQFYTDMFVNYFKRNPTNVECFQLGQANSEHSRHWFFKGKLIIDGQAVPETLFQIVQSTLKANPSNSVIAFKDNSSAIKGFDIWTIIPQTPGQCSPFVKGKFTYHIIFTAETHNFPSGVAPFPGAETGTGGRIRDVHATGRGSLVVAGTAGYSTGCLNIPDYYIPGELVGLQYPSNLATPLQILIGESNGATDYGNKFGEPVILGFTRTGAFMLPNGERRENIKPIMFTGGIGQIEASHTEKHKARKGMLIVQIGGPAYRIGLGGGSASSMLQGENKENLDFNAVQRGDAQMENKMNRVIRACVEMGDENPIVSIHDQGAGGPCNVLTELVEPIGGRVDIRKIILGDYTLSVLEIWGAEFQERNGFLIRPERIEEFLAICKREKVNCEILGEITGDGKIVVYDSQDDSTPVDLELAKILGDMPQKEFKFDRIPKQLQPLKLPQNLTVEEALKTVLLLPTVGSKEWTVNKGDFSVTGLIANRQIDNARGIPVNDVGVIAQSHFGLTGAATSIGEQQIKMLVDVKAGARMAVAEALTNMAGVRITGHSDIKCSVNWMWAAKLPGEGAELYDAAVAMRDIMIDLGIAADGGKDSLSMAAKVGNETVKAPGQMVISAYAPVPDIRKVVNPDIKMDGGSVLIYIDLGIGKTRMGGSALAQAFGQIGNDCPDIDDPQLLANSFKAIQQLIDKGLILACHDKSDGGLITTLVEMAISGRTGFHITVPGKANPIKWLFNEEAGWVIEVAIKDYLEVSQELEKQGVRSYSEIGETHSSYKDSLLIGHGSTQIFFATTPTLLSWWRATSIRLEQEQGNPETASQLICLNNQVIPKYNTSFTPRPTAPEIMQRSDKPKVAIVREEGHNGDREMSSAFYLAGFEVWDVTMTDIAKGIVTQDMFKGVAFVGGFAYLDVFDSAKGQAGVIKFNPTIKKFFDEFFARQDTFSLGICNGCQLMALLGIVPWQGIDEVKQPRFIRNLSGKFESRWVTVRIFASPSIMLKGMEGSILGTYVAHGEGRLYFPDMLIRDQVIKEGLAPIVYVDDSGNYTEQYPFNPNGSAMGLTALCSSDGRHIAMMNHIERGFLPWQWAYMPPEWKDLEVAPWLKAFQNAREWCDNN